MSKSALSADTSPVSVIEAKALFSAWQNVPVIVLAVSGGPDSTALLWLAARWRKALKRGPKLVAITVDHGLRPEAKAEAHAVKRLALSRDRTSHAVLARREAIHRIAGGGAYGAIRSDGKGRAAGGATHIMTAHSRDDQAETVLMRLARGSGIGGLAAMSRESIVPTRDTDDVSTIVLARPLLDIPKVDDWLQLARAQDRLRRGCLQRRSALHACAGAA